MHNDKSSDAGDGDGRNAAVGLVLAGLAERVAARLAPKTVADLREVVEKGRGDDLAHWLTNVVVNALDERVAHFTLPPDFQSEDVCERCGGVVAFGIDYLAPGCSAQWEDLPEQCLATTTGGRCGWVGCGGALATGRKTRRSCFKAARQWRGGRPVLDVTDGVRTTMGVLEEVLRDALRGHAPDAEP